MAAADKPEDLALPQAVVSRIISDALPSGTMVSMEAKKAISKAASVFILYASATAAGISTKSNKKTMMANDVLDAMTEMDFQQFKEPMEKALQKYRTDQKKKKETAEANKRKKPANDNDNDDNEEESHENGDSTVKSTPKSPRSNSPSKTTSSPKSKKKNSSSPAKDKSSASSSVVQKEIEVITMDSSSDEEMNPE